MNDLMTPAGPRVAGPFTVGPGGVAPRRRGGGKALLFVGVLGGSALFGAAWGLAEVGEVVRANPCHVICAIGPTPTDPNPCRTLHQMRRVAHPECYGG